MAHLGLEGARGAVYQGGAVPSQYQEQTIKESRLVPQNLKLIYFIKTFS